MELQQRQESMRDYDTVRRTTCENMCETGCGMKIFVKDGKIVDIFGDDEHSQSKGSLCPKGLASFQHIYNPIRVKYPMIRETLDDKFRRVSWDKALDFVAERMKATAKKYGPEALYIHRTGRSSMGNKWGGARFGKLFGTPNIFGQGPICTESPGIATNYTFGAKDLGRLMNPSQDWVNSKCIMIVGSNMAACEVITFRWVLDAKERGAKVIVIDPRFNATMAKADIAMRLRPGTDAALTMAMANIIIREELYDKKFVNKWVKGFEEWAEECRKWTPEKAENVTWVPKETIIEAARTFAQNTPSQVTGNLGTAQVYNSININRCYVGLLALTGSIGVPGGGWNWLHNCRPPISYGNPLKKGRTYPHPKRPPLSDKLVPWGDNSAGGILNPILTGKPYPIKGIIWNGNLMAQLPNVNKFKKAMKNIDIAVHLSIHPNLTYQHAHAVFPISCWVEREGLVHHGNNRLMQWYNQIIEPLWECRADIDFWAGLADRFGWEEEFPWRKDVTEKDGSKGWRIDKRKMTDWFNSLEPMTAGCMSDVLDPEKNPPGGIMWPCYSRKEAVFDKKHNATVRGKWIMYEDEPYPESDPPQRFPTPSGKIEMASDELKNLGWDSVPIHREPSETPIASPKLYKKYPLVLSTGRLVAHFHEMGHWWPWTSEVEPDRFIQIHPRVAKILGVEDGDIVVAENDRGPIEGPAWVSEMVDPREVWIPEGFDEVQPFHPYESVNVLIDDIIKDPVYNQPQYKCALIRVYKKGNDPDDAAGKVYNFIKKEFPEYDTDVCLGVYAERKLTE
ncbi:hypothetical protein BEH94_08790 [Candidatus Altiarchaeales archaeon WOR_SM1_SCG]|nr:hypothetical protein BEH94_08790 [Candidatus Altiarchaeales archaeon WOR_SM1_SCG]